MSSYIRQYYLNNYVHLSICVGLLVAFTYGSIDLPVDGRLVVLTSIGSLALYNYHSIFRYNYDDIKKSYLTPEAIILYLLLAICLVISTRLDNFVTLLPIALAFLGCMIYFIPYNHSNITGRETTYTKIGLISFVFSMLTSVSITIATDYSMSYIILLALARGLFVGALAIAFDIGDLLMDMNTNTYTLPRKIGTNSAKYVASIMLVLAVLIEAYCAWSYMIELRYLIALMITYTASFISIIISNPRRSKAYFLFVVDGMMGLPYLISYLV